MAHRVPDVADGRSGSSRSRFFMAVMAALMVVSAIAVEAPAATQAHNAGHNQVRAARAVKTNKPDKTTSGNEASRIVRLAASHIGARFRLGTEGPRTFDCSGLIYRVYKQAGLLNKIGGARRLAAGYYYWFKKHGAVSRGNPQVGDLVIWKEKGRIAHSGIYVGHGHVISALINPWGVKRTHINTLHARFFAFLHVHLTR